MVISGRFCFLFTFVCIRNTCTSEADPGFQISGGALTKLRRAEGDAKIVWVFRVKNHDFTQKNLIFSNLAI